MMQDFLRIIAGTVLVASLVVGLSFVSLQAAGAQNPRQAACEGSGGKWTPQRVDGIPDAGTCTTPGQTRSVTSTLRQIGNVLIYLVGAISVLMIVVGGMRYTLAQGDSNATAAAKNTVLYALIGIIVSVAAYALVNFVITGIGE